jgi:DNA-binding ferritin-like protein
MSTIKNRKNKSNKFNKSNKKNQTPRQRTNSVYRTGGAKKSVRMNGKYNINNREKSNIVKMFLQVLNMVKLYHWKTHSFAQHKATDELYERLNENIDKFVEILLGKDQSRVKMLEKRIDLTDSDNLKDFKSKIFEYRTFLTDMNMFFDTKRDSDLLSVRDEILGDINQFLYLLTFDK